MKILLTLFLCCIIAPPILAAPLTNYSWGMATVDLGVTAPRLSATYEEGNGALLSDYGSNYGLAYSATMGVGKPFAVRIHGDIPLAGDNFNYRFADQNIEFLWGFNLNKPTFLVLYTGFAAYQIGGKSQVDSSPFTALKFGLILDYEYQDKAKFFSDFSWSGDATTIAAGVDCKIADQFSAGASINGVVLHSGAATSGPLASCYSVDVWYPALSVNYKF